MKAMGFSLTTAQMRERTKTVTRRLGWLKAKPGDRALAVEKAMGLRKGEQRVRLGVIEIVGVRRERLDAIMQEDVIAEGFPEMTPAEFVAFFCKQDRKLSGATEVTRIEFKFIEDNT
jgi:hypothetical protein